MMRRRARPTLFPYTTLFRSSGVQLRACGGRVRNIHARVSVVRAMPAYLEFRAAPDRKSTRLNSSHQIISYAVFCLKKKIAWTCGEGLPVVDRPALESAYGAG